MIFPVGWLHLSVKTVVMEIFAIWEAMILSSVFDGINERLEIGLSLLSSLESRVSFLIRGRTIYWLLKSEGKKPFSRGKFIIVVMVGRRTSMQFFRSHVRSFFFSEVFNSAKLLLDLFIPGTLKYLLLKSFKLVD